MLRLRTYPSHEFSRKCQGQDRNTDIQGRSRHVRRSQVAVFVPNTSGQIIPNGGGNSAINITLNYAPTMTLGNRQEAENTLLPYILSGIRAAQANGLLATV